MKHLILIKHSAPLVDTTIPSEQWGLSDSGIALIEPLAQQVRQYDIAAIVSSDEPKAHQTAQLLGQRLGIEVRTDAGLREHDRRNVPHMQTRDFISAVAYFFQQPDRRVLGSETANQARERFSSAVDACVAQHGDGNLAIVSHGTVLALYLERVAALKPFALWRAMGLPSFVVLNWPKRDVAQVVNRVA